MLCEYGCGQEATYQFKNGKWCCSKSHSSCPAMRKKKSECMNKSEVKEKISKSSKEAQNRPEVKEKKSRAITEAWNNLTTRKKITEAQEKVWNDLEFRERHKSSIVEAMNRPETKKRNSRAQKEAQNRPEVKEKHSKATKEAQNRPEVKNKKREFMMNGGAALCNAGLKNKSFPQMCVFKMTFLLLPSPILNYQFCRENGRSYFLDIADPRLGINIEYDSSRWHKDLEKDKQRDRELEEHGWMILRYRDKIPTLEQLREDIFSIK